MTIGITPTTTELNAVGLTLTTGVKKSDITNGITKATAHPKRSAIVIQPRLASVRGVSVHEMHKMTTRLKEVEKRIPDEPVSMRGMSAHEIGMVITLPSKTETETSDESIGENIPAKRGQSVLATQTEQRATDKN